MHLLACALCAAMQISAERPAPGLATITVVDAAGKPIQGARVDHTGKPGVLTVIPPAVQADDPQPRSGADGRVEVWVGSPAVIVRKPGFESQRIRPRGGTSVRVTLQRITPKPKCNLQIPRIKTKQANDVDYTATWTYVETKSGRKGIITGRGPSYSWGAPSDSQVWQSVEYSEVMYEDGMIDARGRMPDGTYWRSRTRFGAAAQYYKVGKADAELLDCLMERCCLPAP